MKKILILSMSLAPICAHADILSSIQGISSQIPDASWGGIGMVAGVIELVLRLIPSTKPLSILYLVDDGLSAVGGLFSKAGALLDKVLPQRIKQ